MSHQEALERIAFREECIDVEAEEMRQLARRSLGWQTGMTFSSYRQQGEKEQECLI